MSEFGGGKCPNFGGGKCPPGKWLTILTVTSSIDNIPFQNHRPEDKPVSTLKEVEEATIKVKNEEEADKEEASLVSQITSWATLRPLLITCYLHFVQNWCGVNVIVFKVSWMFWFLDALASLDFKLSMRQWVINQYILCQCHKSRDLFILQWRHLICSASVSQLLRVFLSTLVWAPFCRRWKFLNPLARPLILGLAPCRWAPPSC